VPNFNIDNFYSPGYRNSTGSEKGKEKVS